MASHPILERYLWFDRQIRQGRHPNAVSLAERFELSRKTAQRHISFLRERLDAPLEYDAVRRGYRYADDAFRLPPLFATERQLLALLMARHLLKTGGGRLERDLEKFAEVADEVPTGDVNIYGWSSDGSGGSTKLPSAQAEIRGESPLALYEAPTALEVALKDGARIQPGDSGGAIFADGKVAAIMSAGLFEDPDNPTEEEMTSNAAVAVAPVADQVNWIRGIIGANDAMETGEASEPGGAAAEAPSEGSEGIWGTVGIGAGVAALGAAGVWLLLRRRAA